MFPSQALAQGIIDSLIAGGVRDFVYCPGSRNAPFAYALARLEAQAKSPIRVHVRLDERSAAFFALGLNLDASASQRRGPARACVITTSGSAVAELYPAIVEARYSRVPLLAISADRPVDLHGVGASQTMTQQGLFSPHVVGEWNFSTAREELESIPDRMCRALAASAGAPSGTPGPVHINCEFRDPLVPEDFQTESVCEAHEGNRRAEGAVYPAQFLRDPLSENILDPARATVVIAGQGAEEAVLEWAARSRVPVFAEPMVTGVPEDVRVPFQQTLLGDEEVTGRFEQIIVTGRPTLSRPVQAVCASGKRVVVVASYGQWPDLHGSASCVVPSLHDNDCVDEARQLLLLESLRERVKEVRAGIEEMIASYGDTPSAFGVMDMVWQLCPRVFLGASNPVRIADLIAYRHENASGPTQVWSNRGLAGIDGNTSTALGWASACARLEGADCSGVTAVMGGLTFLHGASGLGLPRGEEFPPLRVIVLDDSGGSIFESLEHGRTASAGVYERYFGVSQRADIPALAKSYGVKTRTISSLAKLREILASQVEGLEVLHLPISRPTEDIAHLRSL